MRVIEYGHIKPKEVKCNHCGALLEYTYNDFDVKRLHLVLQCPVCGGFILKDNNGKEFAKVE